MTRILYSSKSPYLPALNPSFTNLIPSLIIQHMHLLYLTTILKNISPYVPHIYFRAVQRSPHPNTVSIAAASWLVSLVVQPSRSSSRSQCAIGKSLWYHESWLLKCRWTCKVLVVVGIVINREGVSGFWFLVCFILCLLLLGFLRELGCVELLRFYCCCLFHNSLSRSPLV